VVVDRGSGTTDVDVVVAASAASSAAEPTEDTEHETATMATTPTDAPRNLPAFDPVRFTRSR
jgi:hypothetical protein